LWRSFALHRSCGGYSDALWHPFTSEAVETLRKSGPLDEIVLLPLYPHISYATTLSSLQGVAPGADKRSGKAAGKPPERTILTIFTIIRCIVQALVNDRIRVAAIPDSSRIHLVFSAHGYP